MKGLSLVLALMLGDAEGAPRVAYNTGLVVKVTDREGNGDKLVETAEKLGGYFSSRSDDTVVLKVPVEKRQELLAVAEPMGIVVSRRHEALDLGQTLAEQKTRLASRRKMFERYDDVLRSASADAVVSVEHEMTRLVQEIEQLAGSVRLLEHRLSYATLTVSFQFQDRRPPLADGSSSFDWLNRVNLADLLWEFHHED